MKQGKMRHGDKLEQAQKLAVGRIMEVVDRVADYAELSAHGRHVIRLAVFKELGIFENKVREGLADGGLLNASDDKHRNTSVSDSAIC